MKFGVCVPNYGTSSSPQGIVKVALEAERLGYDSVWTTDHILMSRKSGTPYERIFDSIVTLGCLAPQTRRVKLGISSLIVAMRNPVAVVKQLATLDAFSNGRIMLGVGVGWNEREFASVGSDFHDRGRRVDESIRLMKSLWKGETSFQSRHIPQRFEDAVFDPRPVSKELTVWIGGTSEAAMRRACLLGDAWHPNVFPMETFRKLVAQYRKVAESAGGKSEGAEICVRIGLDTNAEKAVYVGPQGEKRIRLTGDMNGVNSKVISDLEGLGVSYAIVGPSPDGNTSTEYQLKSIGLFAKRFL
jgi:probable F420-dependent oxidoreductase